MRFQNPIIPGFAPDPSVVLVNGTFFLVNSSFHLFPGLPIYASKDLNSWAQIGNAINRPGQINLTDSPTRIFPIDTGHKIVAASGLYAPTIRYHNGRFYIICTNCTGDGESSTTSNFYITCEDIWTNSWSNPVFFEFKGIDPSLFFDDGDRAYIQGCFETDRKKQPSSTIKQFEVDILTGKPLTDTKEIWSGFAKYDSEGPHIYKKDGWYYLLIAEGGTFEHHMLSIARSRDIWGPYESSGENPVLTADGTNEYIQNTGHGEFFQDAKGAWWAAVLGVRDEEGRTPLGRETFLTPVTWESGSWPKAEHPKMSFDRESPLDGDASLIDTVLGCEFVYIRNPVLENYRFESNYRTISLQASQTNLSVSKGTATFVGKRQRALDSRANATLIITKEVQASQIAGLAVWKDELRHAEIYYDFDASRVCFEELGENKIAISPAMEDLLHLNVEFQIVATKSSYTFSFRREGVHDWTILGAIDSTKMTARDFTGTVFGVYASQKTNYEGAPITFKDFEISSA